jgi:hypothetical protein
MFGTSIKELFLFAVIQRHICIIVPRYLGRISMEEELYERTFRCACMSVHKYEYTMRSKSKLTGCPCLTAPSCDPACRNNLATIEFASNLTILAVHTD